MNFECMFNKYDINFQKFLANTIDISKMASIIYGVSVNGKRGIGYTPPRSPIFGPKSKEMVIKTKALYSLHLWSHT